MTVPAFSESELKVVDIVPESPFANEFEVFDYPVSNVEAVRALYRREPVWQLIGLETQTFTPRLFPDNVARAFVFEAQPFDPDTEGGGKDMFGVNWVYVPSVGGSMEDPSMPPLLEDANDWPEKIVFPDVDSWDWEGSAKANNGTYLRPENFNQTWIQTGWYERLVSFMGFEEAAVAMIEEDQQEAVKALMLRLSDLYIDIIDHFVKYFPDLNGFYIHDDWGSSLDAFFSPVICEEIIVPAMRKVTDHIHSLNRSAELHSCGSNWKQVPNMIKAGWDIWQPQAGVNDIDQIYETYGDQIIIGVPAKAYDPETATEDDQRAMAREYVLKYCNPQKPTRLNNIDSGKILFPAYRKELYIGSRKRYSGESY